MIDMIGSLGGSTCVYLVYLFKTKRDQVISKTYIEMLRTLKSNSHAQKIQACKYTPVCK